MFRKTVNGDISDEDFNKILLPFNDNFDEFLESYIIPEVIAFYIANSFYRNAMWGATFYQHYNSAKDMFNLDNENYKKVKKEVIKLLEVKYALKIICEDPLDLEKIEY